MKEREILVCCALRFDGWSYIKDQKFDHQEALNQHFESGQWNLAPLEQLAVFFVLQRGLMEWGLDREPESSKYWKALRELFLLCVDYEIPAQYRQAKYYEQWEREYQQGSLLGEASPGELPPQLAECVELIEGIYQSTVYDENPSPLVW